MRDERLRTSVWETTGRKVIRINEMIPKEKIYFDLLTNSLNQFFKKCMEASLKNLYVDRGLRHEKQTVTFLHAPDVVNR